MVVLKLYAPSAVFRSFNPYKITYCDEASQGFLLLALHHDETLPRILLMSWATIQLFPLGNSCFAQPAVYFLRYAICIARLQVTF